MSFSKHANNKANNICVMGNLFFYGRKELKFKTKTDQIINKNLCLGNLSRYWTKDQS